MKSLRACFVRPAVSVVAPVVGVARLSVLLVVALAMVAAVVPSVAGADASILSAQDVETPGDAESEGAGDGAGEVLILRPEFLSVEQLDNVTIGDLIPDPTLSVGVDRVAASSPQYDAAVDAYFNQLRTIATARVSLANAKDTLEMMRTSREEVRDRLAQRRRDRRMLVRELDRIENHLREMALAQYVSSGTTQAHTALQGLDPAMIATAGRSIQLIEEAGEVQLENQAVIEKSLSGLDIDHARDEIKQAKLAESITATQNDIEDWSIALFESSVVLPELESSVKEHRVLAIVEELGLPVVVLDAYNAAAIASEVLHPGCGVQWWMLAGIGKVESGHGTFKGSAVDAVGLTMPEIIGIPLNGNADTAIIGDTDGGVLDRDPVFDRAVGPMQFIPSTWAGNGLDANGDGVANPHNLYDAALSSAHYLCRTAGQVTTTEGLRRGYFAYNHRDSYVNKVLGFALEYQKFVF